MTAFKLMPACAALFLLWGCSPVDGASDAAISSETDAVIPADIISPIRSTEMVIELRVGDGAPRNWTITPELAPDTLIIECPADEVTTVTFTTDLEAREFPMKLDKKLPLFNIVVNDDITALTEIRCIAEIPRYRGDFSPGRASAGDFEADIGPILKTYFNNDGPGIILAIVEGDDVVYEKAVGLADITAGKPRQLSEHFDIASVSKEFTAVSILQLADRGKLSLDDPLSTYFSDLPNADKITLHNLLTHTHGLSHIRTADTYDNSIPREHSVALGHIRDQGAKFAPGEKYDYGNTAYYLLAMIAQQVSGQDRKTYVRENLFAPAGMEDSFFISDDPKPTAPVKGYNEEGGEHLPRTFDYYAGNEVGAADIISTLTDLRKWQRALSNGTVLSKEMFALAVQPKTLNDGTEIARGYGFFHGMVDGSVVIYNSGDFYTHTRHYYVPDRDLSIILNTNGTPEYDGGKSSIVHLQIIGKVLNTQMLEMYDDPIDLNDL